MSWFMSAGTFKQYPKEEPSLERIPEDHPSMADFRAEGFDRPLLPGSWIARALVQATGRAYGELLPVEVPAYVAEADWNAVEVAEDGQAAKRFLELCVKHNFGITMD